ncbi:UDP-N-acetyl-D-mannosamine dehydrogenase [Ghiorsea bivora]|uniref:UDP-N-acetyl-D-mannosamine dehydrogenase n=1 Tax=Ghiorsea bivora TaxID=1485545 RepID=UPI000571BCBB|nr:UDP-N-acetyl-D-mannosamine dehydrogenase [Ghiorsea bivora]
MNNKVTTVTMIGLGYIGLPTAALLANRGYRVHGVDVDKHAVDIINQGKIHIVEPELDTFVHSAVNSGKLTANMVPAEADVFMIAVPTPFHHDKMNEMTNSPIPNIDYVISATKAIAPYIRKGNLILLESTSPVGTTDKMAQVLQNEGVDINEVYIAHSPERVLPGHIMRELVENDRVVGGINDESTKVAAEFYRTFVEGTVLETNAKTAEMAKLTENSFRDVNIAFANELSMLCDDLDIDTRELIALANRHPRVNVLNPGCGVGGHCISVDPWFIVDKANGKAKMIEQARRTNDYKADWVIEKVKNAALVFEAKNNKKPVVACMGLAFKPDIDDLRESPALYITKGLIQEGLDVLAVEPNIENHKDLDITAPNLAVEKADIIVCLVAHKGFDDFDVLTKEVFDFCGVLKS